MDLKKAQELIRTLANMTTPFDGIDASDQEAMDEAEDEITGDLEGDDARALWRLIASAREIANA